MSKIGHYHTLEVVKLVEFGAYLALDDVNEVLLPKRYMPEGCKPGDNVKVFLYLDSDDVPIATTESPLATVGQTAHLKVTDINSTGAFLDWGLPKDVLVPYSEQHKPFVLGNSYVVTLYLDDQTQRIVASSKLSFHLSEYATHMHKQQKVDLLVCGKSDMGHKVVVNHTHLGLIFKDDALTPLKYGQKIKGFIKNIRPDGKLDISLQPHAGKGRPELTDKILQHLEKRGGKSRLTDKARPEDIFREFKVSKGNYKKALGALYKQRKIIISNEEISLVK